MRMKYLILIVGFFAFLGGGYFLFSFFQSESNQRQNIPSTSREEIVDDLLESGELIDSGEVDARDADRDGLTIEEEEQYGTDPQNFDTDEDGIIDGDEVYLKTNPLAADSDGDGFDDAVELKSGYNPLGEGKL